jgi:soluble lytic murein transglycosylase
MSSHAARRVGSRQQAALVRRRRRRLAAVLGVLILAVVALVKFPLLEHAAQELTLPLHHEDIIRQQARAKHLDPALVASVIYAESRFRDGRVSAAGAEGLMQITPETAHAIARRTGGIRFRVTDLGTPQVNISYGCWYLRYLLDHYGGNEVAALAAYNAGMTNVNRWMRRTGGDLTVETIPFSETRAYVRKVQDSEGDYRSSYSKELGL